MIIAWRKDAFLGVLRVILHSYFYNAISCLYKVPYSHSYGKSYTYSPESERKFKKCVFSPQPSSTSQSKLCINSHEAN